MSKKINLYCAGGAGVNIGTHFAKFNGQKEPGFAEIVPYFIDTSKSNITSAVPANQMYLYEDVDGGGKERSSVYEIIADPAVINDILYQFKPADLNIVLHSASGGSGSVIGPVLTGELLKRGAQTVVVMVGNTSCEKEVINTLRTLKSYENIAANVVKAPVIAAYSENTLSTPRGKVDHILQTTIVVLAALFSGENRELDSADLRNFLNYTNVTSHSPRLALLEFFSKDILLSKGQSLASLATLIDDKSDSNPNVMVEYQAVGFLSEQAAEKIDHPLPLHACIISGHFNSIADALEVKISEHEEAKKSRSSKSFVSNNEAGTELGLIL